MATQDELGRRRVAVLEAINALDAKAMSEHATWALLRLVLADVHVPRLPRREREGAQVKLLLGHLAKLQR